MGWTTMIENFASTQDYTPLIEGTLNNMITDYFPFSIVITTADMNTLATGERNIVLGGHYICDGSGALPPATQSPVIVVGLETSQDASTGEPLFGSWRAAVLNDVVGIPAIASTEISTVTKVIGIPTTSTNFRSRGDYMIFGHTTIDYAGLGYGANTPSAPNSEISPFGIMFDSSTLVTTVYFSDQMVTNQPQTWVQTDSGAAPTFFPNTLTDAVYDSRNDRIVAVGNASEGGGSKDSVGTWIEMLDDTTQPTFIYAQDYAGTAGAPDYPCYYRTIDIVSAESGLPTIFMAGGATGDVAIAPIGTGVLTLYQADYDKDWGGGAPRIAGLDNGFDNAGGLWATLGLPPVELPTNITMVKRDTRDGEDIILVGGTADDGPFLYAISGLTTEAGTNVIIPIGVATDVTFAEQRLLSAAMMSTIEQIPSYTVGSRTSVLSVVGFPERRAKLLSGGLIYLKNIYPVVASYTPAFGSDAGFLISVSRGVNITDFQINQQAPSTQYSNLRIGYLENNSTTNTDFCYLINSELGDTRPATAFGTATPTTGNIARCYFEYILYDGVDALIAKKLQQLGIRVTITNTEWYKSSVLKQGLDVDADFFREWADLQDEQNSNRQKLAEKYGASRPAKRPVRTELFDEYAHMEELMQEMDKMRENEADFEVPWSDEIGDMREARIREKTTQDVVRIDEMVKSGELADLGEVEVEENEKQTEKDE